MDNGKTLYIVATPIGNLKDITLRALETLKNVDVIVCEDTRVTSVLLTHYEIKKPLIALNEFNEEQIVYEIIKKLEKQNIALVSDAGTPLISDPGYKLVKTARDKGFSIVPIPGPSALIAALSVSGLPTDNFTFLGFLPKTESKVKKNLEIGVTLKRTVIFYESPHRIIKTLEIMNNLFGDIEVSISRELTKKFEEVRIGKISEHLERFTAKTPKGEFVVIFRP